MFCLSCVGGMSKCMSHSPSPPSEEDLEEAVVSFQYHLVLFQLSHRSPETARQSLSKLLSLSSHSARLWILAAQFEDGTSDSATVLKVLEKARESELESHTAEFYCCAVKLVMKQVKLVLLDMRICLTWYYILLGCWWLPRRVVDYSITMVTKLRLPILRHFRRRSTSTFTHWRRSPLQVNNYNDIIVTSF